MRPEASLSQSRAALLAAVASLLLAGSGPACAPRGGEPPAARTAGSETGLETRNVILITADGLRSQELFGGLDPVVAREGPHADDYYASYIERARSLFWKETAEERRRALMPFFWSTLAPRGVVLGNKAKGSRALVTNTQLFSAPGYVEILTGRPWPEVTSNDLIRYPHTTVLEFVRRELGLGWTEVASIGSWEGFNYLASAEENAFFTNGGYEAVPEKYATPRIQTLVEIQSSILPLYPEGRSDAVTFGIALEYLKKHRPRLLYIPLGESDDWAHGHRYDRYLDYIRIFDGYLEKLWGFLETSEQYRGKTTLILTTDHGRGVTLEDWVEHGEGIVGSEDIWIAVIGPDTPDRGEVESYPDVHQADVAATVAGFFGLDYRKLDAEAGPLIPIAFSTQPSTRASSP